MHLAKWGSRYYQARTWDESTRVLMLSGKHLATLPTEQRKAEYQLKGCESPVWVKYTLENNLVSVKAHSDGKIIRGLIYLIVEPIQGKTKAEFCCFDFGAYLTQLGLTKYLSPTRVHGISALIDTLKSYQ